MIRAIQIARSTWKVYRVEAGPVETLTLRGEVHLMSWGDYHAAVSEFDGHYLQTTPTTTFLRQSFATFQKACEALL